MSRTYSGLSFHFVCIVGFVSLLFSEGTSFIHLNNLKGRNGEGYYVEAELGTPPQKLNLLVDTASSNLAVAGAAIQLDDEYFKSDRSETFVTKKKNVAVANTRGCWNGDLGSDIVSIPSLNNLVPVRCDVGTILAPRNQIVNGSHRQGILGLAYPSMLISPSDGLSWLEAVSYVSGHNVSQYHFRSLPLPFSLELCGPYNDDLDHYGNFYVGDALSVPGPGVPRWVFSPVVEDNFYALLLAGVKVGGNPITMPCEMLNIGKTVVDSGSRDLKLSGQVYEKFVAILIGILAEKGIVHSDDFWLQKRNKCWKQGSEWQERLWLESFPNLTISLAHTPYFKNGYNPKTNRFHTSDEEYPFPIRSYFNLELTSRSYIQKVRPNTRSSLPPGQRENCYQFAVGKIETGTFLGMAVLEGLSIMFNQTGRVVGFAESNCGPDVRVSGPFPSRFDSTPCARLRCDSGEFGQSGLISVHVTAVFLIAVTMAVVVIVAAGRLIFLCIHTAWIAFRFRYLRVPSKKKDASVANLVVREI